MKPDELNKKYFEQKTRGYNIISRFYYKYQDLFIKTGLPSFNDFLHQVFLNISGINFSKEINNNEAYIIGAIKIQCRAQLDKAVKSKIVTPENFLPHPDDESEPVTETFTSNEDSPALYTETADLVVKVNLFKYQLKPDELEILNSLIDERTREEISESFKMNINTVDTKIRRIRIKFYTYLKKIDYNHRFFNKKKKSESL